MSEVGEMDKTVDSLSFLRLDINTINEQVHVASDIFDYGKDMEKATNRWIEKHYKNPSGEL